jgi:hypothetical protein
MVIITQQSLHSNAASALESRRSVCNVLASQHARDAPSDMEGTLVPPAQQLTMERDVPSVLQATSETTMGSAAHVP